MFNTLKSLQNYAPKNLFLHDYDNFFNTPQKFLKIYFPFSYLLIFSLQNIYINNSPPLGYYTLLICGRYTLYFSVRC